MKQTPLTPKGSPSGQKTPVKTVDSAQDISSDAGSQFIAAALTMSWQLAIVVLVPVIGGFELDKKLNMLPLLTIVGFVLAMIGMAAVVWRQMQLYGPAPAGVKSGRQHS